MRYYTVSVTDWRGTEDIDRSFYAKNASDAISKARRYMRDYVGWTPSDGKLTYRARVADRE